MSEALTEAHIAFNKGEVPVGAVIVKDGEIIARGHNQREEKQNALSHAEIECINEACKKLGSWRLDGCKMYVTLEPCPMCAAACRWSQIGRVVWGADDPKGGFRRYSESLLHPKTVAQNGLMAEECAELMKKFFSELRN